MAKAHRQSACIPVAFAALLALQPGVASAVCLNGNPSVKQEYRESSFVLTGRVVSATDVPDKEPDFIAGTRYVVRVVRVFRGHPDRTITLWSENTSGRFPMDVGGQYLVFLRVQSGEVLAIDACGNSGIVSQKQSALSIVRRLSKPAPQSRRVR